MKELNLEQVLIVSGSKGDEFISVLEKNVTSLGIAVGATACFCIAYTFDMPPRVLTIAMLVGAGLGYWVGTAFKE